MIENQTEQQSRKLATKLNDDGVKIHAMCGHCQKLIFLDPSGLDEVNRVNLDSHSAQVTYNFVCDKCGSPGQLNLVVEDN